MLQTMVNKAKSGGLWSVVLTFSPHPREVLQPGYVLPKVCTDELRATLFEQAGVDAWVKQTFDNEFSKLTGQAFVQEILLGKLNAKTVVVGQDFRFGENRSAGVLELHQWLEQTGRDLIAAPLFKLGDQVVSTSQIRTSLANGDVDRARTMLGRPFVYTGIVEHGQGKGRQIGVPTANFFRPASMVTLPHGVYVTQIKRMSKIYRCVTNVGVRPTAGGSESLGVHVETHLLDTSVDLYGEKIDVEFLTRLREERRFQSMDELKMQIKKDIQSARES